HAIEVAVRDAERLGKLGIELGQLRLLDAIQPNVEGGFLSGHGLSVVVVGELEREGLALAGLHAARRRLELRQHAALAEHEREARRLAAVEGLAADAAV